MLNKICGIAALVIAIVILLAVLKPVMMSPLIVKAFYLAISCWVGTLGIKYLSK